MEVIKNVTVYKCSYCGKRLLTKKGAKIHENKYCWHSDSPHQKSIVEKKEKCEHKNVETQYSYIPGEAVKEPSHNECMDCGSIV